MRPGGGLRGYFRRGKKLEHHQIMQTSAVLCERLKIHKTLSKRGFATVFSTTSLSSNQSVLTCRFYVNFSLVFVKLNK